MKLNGLIFSVTVFVALILFQAKAQSSIEQNGLVYTIISEYDNTCSVKASLDLTGNVYIPETVNIYGSDFKVISIERSGFYEADIDSIFLPTSIGTIEYGAFSHSKVRYVDLNQVGKIERYGFYATNLCELTIPSSVTSIYDDAFSKCENLVSVRIESDIYSLPTRVFAGCNNLKRVELVGNVYSLGAAAFKDCNVLA